MIAAMNTLPTDTASRSAMMMSMMLGGIRIPRVPDAAMVPLAPISEILVTIGVLAFGYQVLRHAR